MLEIHSLVQASQPSLTVLPAKIMEMRIDATKVVNFLRSLCFMQIAVIVSYIILYCVLQHVHCIFLQFYGMHKHHYHDCHDI